MLAQILNVEDTNIIESNYLVFILNYIEGEKEDFETSVTQIKQLNNLLDKFFRNRLLHMWKDAPCL